MLCLHPLFQMQSRRVRPADMQTIGVIGNWRADEGRQRGKIYRGAGLDQFGDGFHPDPQARMAGQREAEQAERDQLGNGCGVQHRKRSADEAVF